VRTGFSTERLIPDGDLVTVVSRDPAGIEQKVTVDRVVAPRVTARTTASRRSCGWTSIRSSAPRVRSRR